MLLTYRTKLKNIDVKSSDYLTAFSEFFGKLERKLFLQSYIQGISLTECKKEFIKKYSITARQFNSISMQLSGKVSSVKELRKIHLEEIEGRIQNIERRIKDKLSEKEKVHAELLRFQNIYGSSHKKIASIHKKYLSIKFFLHQKKRKLRNLKQRLEKLAADESANRIRICFGSRDLFKNQFNLNENGYGSHGEWKRDWISARSSQFLCVGSKDESFGNQNCSFNKENTLRLRVADKFKDGFGEYICFYNVQFPYGQEALDAAKVSYQGLTKGGKTQKYFRAITCRFMKNRFGWYVNATVDTDMLEMCTSNLDGCIGIDLNAGFLSMCEVDRYGNPIKEWKINVPMYGRSSEQVTASIGNAVKEAVDYAETARKPIAYENLDFSKKKNKLGESGKKYSRMLSGFAYSKFKEMLLARAGKSGVEIKAVNPAYTSIIGQTKFMKRYGLSSHGSAACVIGRRGIGCRFEKFPTDNILDAAEKFKGNTPDKKKWSDFSYYVKKRYFFNDRIELLKMS